VVLGATAYGQVINEFLYDPGTSTGDANGDGTIDTSEDEFVEIVNDTGGALDLTDWTLEDAVGLRHTFPAGTVIPDMCAVVVFGGGTPIGAFGGATVQVASTGFLGLNNSGDTITLRDDGGVLVTEYIYPDTVDDESVTLDPDITGVYVAHSLATGSGGALFSPGTYVDGTDFSGCAPPVTGACCDESDGSCTDDVTEASCPGRWGGAGSTCATIDPPCVAVVGACCLAGVCVDDYYVTDCTDDGGEYQGDDSLCVDVTCPLPPAVFINEYLYDPGSSTGDANGDGTADTSEDEFVEIVNATGADLDMSDWTLEDAVGLRHAIPAGTVIPNDCAIVVFGGGTPTGTFGDATVQVASTGFLGLNNGGDTISLFNDGGLLVAQHVYADTVDDESVTRDPDVTGGYVAHSTATGSGGALFSPGTQIDGTSFSGCTAVQTGACCTAGDCSDGLLEAACTDGGGVYQGNGTLCIDVTCPSPPDIFINEYLYDPGPDVASGDANGDGVRDSGDDEFVEIVNATGAALDLSDWYLNDEFSLRHTFPAGTIVPDGCAIVVFGGGTPTGSFGDAVVQTASVGFLGLNNGGDVINLFNDSGVLVGQESYDGSIIDQSLTRDPDITGTFVGHTTATGSGGAEFSPGTQIDGTSFAGCGPSGPFFALNEIYVSHSGSPDDQEMIEVIGTPDEPMTNLVVLAVESDDQSSAGTIDDAWDLSAYVMPSDGYFVLGTTTTANVDLDIGAGDVLENSSTTFYLLDAIDAAAVIALLGSDLDSDNDCVYDVGSGISSLGTILDVVTLIDSGPTDCNYDGAPVLGPDGTFFPAGIFRDADYPGDWCDSWLDFDDVANLDQPRTPGAANGVCPAAATGACCDEATGICADDVSEVDCTGGQLRYGGDGSDCATLDPPCVVVNIGACCIAGSCEDGYAEDDCTVRGGIYQGNGSDCGSVTCPTPPSVIISEIMYNPGSYEGTSPDFINIVEWVEIYNNGDTAVDISGWSLLDEDPTDPPDYIPFWWATGPVPATTTIDPGEAVVLVPGPDTLSTGPGITDAEFQAGWGGSFQIIQLDDWNDNLYSLSSSPFETNEILTLLDGSGVAVDVANYDDGFGGDVDWPNPFPGGPSIYVQCFALDRDLNDDGTNWLLSEIGVDGAYQVTETGIFFIDPGESPIPDPDRGSPGYVFDCGDVTGACCDRATLNCTDGVLALDCMGVDEEWTANTLCADLDPPCAIVPTGACCYAGHCADGVEQAACESGGGAYQGDDSDCASVTCPAGPNVVINEIRIDQSGSADPDEYFELVGDPGASLDGLTYIVIGDGSGGSGVIEAIIPLTGSSIPVSGYFLATEDTFTLGTPDLVTTINFENSDNVTHLLVAGFTGTNQQDLDDPDDGTLDITPWAGEFDRIALVEDPTVPPPNTEYHYGPPSVGPDGNFVPAHAFRCVDMTGDWTIGLFDLGADDTPGAPNACSSGACCATDGTCSILSPQVCDFEGGTYNGDDTTCEGDADGDLIDGECGDGCPNDPDKTDPGICGCGTPDDDSDGDGVADCNDPCPQDNPDDTDGDGACDSDDPCPLDNPDDTDGDGVCDSDDPCPLDNPDDTDGDGVCDSDDPCPLDNPDDSDGDGFCDTDDGCPNDPDKTSPGVCGCGVPDDDSDGDTIPDCNDVCDGLDDRIDLDGNGTPDCLEGLVPTVSEWGLAVLALVLMVVAKLSFGRRRDVVA
jgi:hypothetical protein